MKIFGLNIGRNELIGYALILTLWWVPNVYKLFTNSSYTVKVDEIVVVLGLVASLRALPTDKNAE